MTIPALSLRHLAAWVVRRRRRYRVTGDSMLPTLRSGETVLVNPRAYRGSTPAAGDVVVLEHPERSGFVVIKRVSDVAADGVWVLGDNPALSTDSRAFGRVALHLVHGRVVCRFSS